MMFEVEDLAVASPATVSRCGMVFMEPNSMGLSPIIDSWMEIRMTDTFLLNNNLVPLLKSLFATYLDKCIEFVRKYCLEIVETMNNNLASSLTRNLNCFLADYQDNEYKKISIDEIDKLFLVIDKIFIFSLIWSVGSTITQEGRELFDLFIRDLMKTNNCSFSVNTLNKLSMETYLLYIYSFPI